MNASCRLGVDAICGFWRDLPLIAPRTIARIIRIPQAQRSQLASREAALRSGHSSEHIRVGVFCAIVQCRPATACFAQREVVLRSPACCIFFCAQFSREPRQRNGKAPTQKISSQESRGQAKAAGREGSQGHHHVETPKPLPQDPRSGHAR